MARVNITESSDADVIARSTDRFFTKARATTPAINTTTYAGNYVQAVLIATDAQLSEAQMDALETQIEAISGGGVNVTKAFVLIGSKAIPTARVPAATAETEYTLHIDMEATFDIKANPVTP